MRIASFLFLWVIFSPNYLLAQFQKCYSQIRFEKRMQADPELRERYLNSLTESIVENKNNAIITIPVVVHVIWNLNRQNISNEQIQSQIDVLNKDFRALNSDLLPQNHPFRSLVGDAQIEFCLAKIDPNGSPTNGITRTKTNVPKWTDDNFNDLFFTVSGGKDNWDATKYLNIYVIESDGSTLGFASFPEELKDYPDYDGVVLHHEVFGTKGTAGTGDYPENKLGRTATHEVGHWLNLLHIWGDEECGNDFIADTPPAESETYECVQFPYRPLNDCGSGPNGEMFMNYMDYVDDYCMNMFTKGQTTRMKAAMNGIRKSILSSSACLLSNSTHTYDTQPKIKIFPNPSIDGNVNIEIEQPGQTCRIEIFDAKGLKWNAFSSCQTSLIKLPPGFYFVIFSTPDYTTTQKLIVSPNRIF